MIVEDLAGLRDRSQTLAVDLAGLRLYRISSEKRKSTCERGSGCPAPGCSRLRPREVQSTAALEMGGKGDALPVLR